MTDKLTPDEIDRLIAAARVGAELQISSGAWHMKIHFLDGKWIETEFEKGMSWVDERSEAAIRERLAKVRPEDAPRLRAVLRST